MLFIITLSFKGFCQIDEIKKTNGENIICKVDSINTTHVFYHFPNELETQYISKISINYIRYNSGRYYKIENREKYPTVVKDSYIKACFESISEKVSDTINNIKKLNYCLTSFKSIESTLSLKEYYKLNTLSLNNPYLLDFIMDISLINSNELFNNSPTYYRYLSFIVENSNIFCECISQKNKYDKDISKNKLDCNESFFIQKFIKEKTYFGNMIYTIFKDTISNFIGEVVGSNLLNDIEKALYNNCDLYINEKINERKKRFEKYKIYDSDSLKNELNKLMSQNYLLDDKYYLKRGLLYFYLGDYDKSVSDYDHSNNIKKGIALFFKSELYDFLNNYDNSIKFYKEFQKISNIKMNDRILLLEKLKIITKEEHSL